MIKYGAKNTEEISRDLAILQECRQMMQYGDINPSLHWLRQWLVSWRRQAITWTNIDLSDVFYVIHMWPTSQESLMNLTLNMYSEITLFKLLSHLPGANGLIMKLS